jgi:hypothetical protein
MLVSVACTFETPAADVGGAEGLVWTAPGLAPGGGGGVVCEGL